MRMTEDAAVDTFAADVVDTSVPGGFLIVLKAPLPVIQQCIQDVVATKDTPCWQSVDDAASVQSAIRERVGPAGLTLATIWGKLC